MLSLRAQAARIPIAWFVFSALDLFDVHGPVPVPARLDDLVDYPASFAPDGGMHRRGEVCGGIGTDPADVVAL
jgi:hypothetical protein